ncbi:spexin [Vombatus ursinus]|uniref:spexin n=1 Tax=Vombatus ursinus TaxID=29139 RepID=UPI000FFD2783|nr:spexin [Vombatus ursinus]
MGTKAGSQFLRQLAVGIQSLKASGLALLLAVSFISLSCCAPQRLFERRNWTPQAILYLKGTQGRQFISEENQRKDLYNRLQLAPPKPKPNTYF